MNRRLVGLAVVAAIAFSYEANAQATRKPKSFGDVTAASQALILKNEACRREAKALKLGFFKRRVFMHKCLHR